MSQQPILHSIVIPVFNEEAGLESLFTRMQAVAQMLPDTCEVVLVNDGSRDRSAAILDTFHQRDARFKVVHFSRNFGHQMAVTAGMDVATGDTVTLMDADLQDPPEVIAEFIAKWREGYEVVFGVRRHREGETPFKLFTAKLFYRIIRSLTNIDIPVDTGDFRLMDRKVVEALKQLPERHRFIRGLVSWVGFRQVGVEYNRAARIHGETHYPFRKMLKFAIDGVTSFSVFPLQMATYFGFFSALLAFFGILTVGYLKFFTDRTIQGWTSLAVMVLFLGGVQLFSIGIIGEYLGRAVDEMRRRPLYLISKTIGFDKS